METLLIVLLVLFLLGGGGWGYRRWRSWRSASHELTAHQKGKTTQIIAASFGFIAGRSFWQGTAGGASEESLAIRWGRASKFRKRWFCFSLWLWLALSGCWGMENR